ncbi:hypothetical protein ACPXCO_23080 [Streptomyces cyaneofuscatus]|uniref:hypothetical protein n=1 Tax=Streptomyces cyaneofuscatus TaxID=66883 RepID=UPI003CE69135
MTTPDLNAGDLPHLTADRPHHRSDSHRTARELFGYEGQFFTVPGTFPGGLPDHVGFIPAVYVVLRTPDHATGTHEFTVRDVNGHRRILGTPDPDQDTAIRNALSTLAERRRDHARQVEHNRIHVLGLDPVPPVRIGHTATGTCVVHVRCSCPQVEGLAAHYEHVSLAAADWLAETPATPWEFCPTSPTGVTTQRGRGRLTGTLRNDKGMAVVEVEHRDGHREAVALAQVSDLA